MSAPAKLLVAFDFWDGHCVAVAGRVADGARSVVADTVLKRVTDIVRATPAAAYTSVEASIRREQAR